VALALCCSGGLEVEESLVQLHKVAASLSRAHCLAGRKISPNVMAKGYCIDAPLIRSYRNSTPLWTLTIEPECTGH